MANDPVHEEPSSLRRVVLALATLGLVGFSLVLTCQTSWLSNPMRTAFVERNTLGEHGRTLLLLSLAAGLAAPVLVGLLVLWRVRQVRVLERAATLCAPLGLLFFVPGLFLAQIPQDKPLFYLVVLAAFGVVFSTLLSNAFGGGASRFSYPLRRLTSVRVPGRIPELLLLACAAGYAFILFRYALARHQLIQDVDVGVADNVMANLLHGRFFQAPAQFGTAGGNWLAVHAEYASALFVPLYALRPGAETLFLLQTVLAALAVVPLYMISVRRLGRATALWVCVAYLLIAPQHGALVGGFSWLPAVTFFFFTLYYAIQSGRRWLLVASLLGLLLISEAGPLYAFGLGCMLIASRAKLRTGLWLVLASLPVIACNLALSRFGRGALEHPPLLSALSTLASNPVFFAWDLARFAKVATILHALAPLCLLPLFELACWPLLIPGLLYTAAGSQFWPDPSSNYAASIIWVPGCFVALSFVLEKRRRQGRGRYAAALVTLTICVLSHSYAFGALLRADAFGGVAPSAVRMTPWAQSRYDNLRAVLDHIPAKASVGATSFLLSHASSRPFVCDLALACGEPDYLLISAREVSAVRSQLAAMFATHHYKLELSKFDEFYLFSRAAETPETRQALSRLGLLASP